MCGISGAVYFETPEENPKALLEASLQCIAKRGPDDEGIYNLGNIWLGHRRLSIIDVTENAHQPFTDPTGRYTIIFNGEIFNFRELKSELQSRGVSFRSSSDTEVLLALFILEGKECLQRLNGFFAFAVVDTFEQNVTVIRDRYGVKPLYYYRDNGRILFASEIKAITAYGIQKEIDPVSLHLYLQLNYVPCPWSMLKGIRQLPPGCCLEIHAEEKLVTEYKWYHLPVQKSNIPYQEACEKLYTTLKNSVERRLVADVPLGAFLSGGVDSSVIVALASKEVKGLHTFSIGFGDEPAFDETAYAKKVSQHCSTVHKEFILKSSDLMQAFPEVMDYLGEPFADSSALAVYILSRETRKHVTVSLSGDGSDELFGGYNKHRAEWLMRNYGWLGPLSRTASPLLSNLKGSRQSRSKNLLRQIHRFAEGSSLSPAERYWRWCSIASFGQASALLKNEEVEYHALERISKITSGINGHDFNEVLHTDIDLVLAGDMLVKVDLMSMANSLEVRTPFLDYEVVELAASLPASYKIDKNFQKKILKDTFGKLLPEDIFTRRKQGFEIPLLRWFRTELQPLMEELTDNQFVQKQGVFEPLAIQQLRNQINSENPGEAASRMWAIIVFQQWWIKNFS